MARWIKGVIWTLLGMMLAIVLFVSVMIVVFIPWAISAVVALQASDSGLVRMLILSPASLLMGVSFFWISFRFLWPSVFGLWRMSGWIFQHSQSVTFRRVSAFLVERLNLMRNEFVWYFARVKT